MITLRNENLSILLDPTRGMGVESLLVNGRELLYVDYTRKASGHTYGIPILFPSPNRVKDDQYVVNGKTISGMMHGFLRHREFVVVSVTDVAVTAMISFDGSDPYFPYRAIVEVTIMICSSTLMWEFRVINQGDEPIAYGLALHPFFLKTPAMKLTTNAIQRFITDRELHPTEEVVDDAPSSDVAELEIDAVFLTDGPVKSELTGRDGAITIEGSQAFTYVVVYTGIGKPFVCVEPQSCATNAHHFKNKKLSGLEELAAHSEAYHWIRFTMEGYQ